MISKVSSNNLTSNCRQVYRNSSACETTNTSASISRRQRNPRTTKRRLARSVQKISSIMNRHEDVEPVERPYTHSSSVVVTSTQPVAPARCATEITRPFYMQQNMSQVFEVDKALDDDYVSDCELPTPPATPTPPPKRSLKRKDGSRNIRACITTPERTEIPFHRRRRPTPIPKSEPFNLRLGKVIDGIAALNTHF